MSKDQKSSIDLLGFIADDRQIVTYRPRWNRLTGSITATIVLQQIIYRWIQSGRRPFYKFTAPCAHPLCRPGDTWEEELGMSRREFDTARGRIAARTQGEVDPNALVSYWITAGHLTWYTINETLLVRRLSELYSPESDAPLVSKPFDKSANGNNGSIQGHSTKPPMATAELPEPLADLSNAIPQIRQQKNRDIHKDNKEGTKITTTDPPRIAQPVSVAVAGSHNSRAVIPAQEQNPSSAILRWIGFADRLSADEQSNLDPATLLAWAYWIFLERTSFNPPKNAIGLARTQWRKGLHPQAELLDLARAWLTMTDEDRAKLLDALELTIRYGYDNDPIEEAFPNLSVATATAIYRATAGALAPPCLSPPPRSSFAEPAAEPAPRPAAAAPSSLWRAVLGELEMQMPRSTFTTWLQASTAAETSEGLMVRVRNRYAVEWLSNRLHPLIQRTVDTVAGRPLPVTYHIWEDR